MKALIPIALILVGAAAGAGAGFALRPAPEMPEECAEPPCAEDMVEEELDLPTQPDPTVTYEYVRIDKQFVVPVLSQERVESLVILSLTVEADPTATSKIEDRMPKLRDSFLQVLFNHAQTGGFEGRFTTGQPMRDLRAALTRTARQLIGRDVHGVLVTDIVRQDL